MKRHLLALRRSLASLAALSAASVPSFAQTNNPAPANDADPQDVTHLSPFVVRGENEQGYSGQQTLIGSRSARNLIDIPANITIINKELLDDLNVSTLSQAVRFGVSGVTQNTNISDDFNIRGFRTEQAMRNGVTKNANRSNPMYDVSRVEVIKGPAAMLLGNNSFLGGAINLVSYQPSAVPTAQVETTFSNDSYVRVAANASGPMYKSRDVNINYRVTVGGLTGDREKSVENLKQKFIGTAFNVYFGSASSLLVNAYYFRDDSYLYYDDFLDLTSTVDAKFNRYSTKSFSPSRPQDNYWKSEDSFLDVQYLTRLSENGNVRFYYSGTSIREHRRHVRGISVAADNYTLARQDIPFFIEKVNHNLQLDYLHHLELSVMKVDSTLGADGSITYSRQSQSVNTPPSIDTRNPDFTADAAFFSAPQSGAGLPYQTDTASKPLNFSYYFQENLSFLKDRLILVGGVRWFNPAGTNENYVTHVVTNRDARHFKVHKYGAVVKILPSVSAYYTDAQNIFVQTGFADKFVAGDALGAAAGNQEGKLKEYGLKFNHKFNDTFTVYGSVAHFEMSLTNIKTVGLLPNGVAGQIISAQDSSHGWEFDYGMTARFGGGHADVVLTYFDGESATAANPTLQAVDFAPRKYSILGKYSWTDGGLKGLMFGAGIMDQSGKRNLTYNVDYPLVVNVFAGYDFNHSWNVQVNLDNLTNKRYIVGMAANGLVIGSDPFQPRLTVRYRW
ncbi:MAG: TonB-dependent siderophore receptor [Verrucomicrobia bacterium]|nr:TonB-dependent siderophore receptor [Verrucomicrobiota bacterium]